MRLPSPTATLLGAQLVQGHHHQQPPQVAAFVQRVRAVAGVDEKAAISRLHHVVRIDAARHLRRKTALGQRGQPADIATEQLVRRLLVAAPIARHQIQ
jgi:hypothetical protein